ncbi:MAG TPA: multiheme c-type cytochrome [Caulobacteraceae bacterium]
MAGRNSWGPSSFSRATVLILALVTAMISIGASSSSPKAPDRGGVHEGVASCAGSMCHGRQVASGPVVRQNELITWQDASSSAGDHSRAWRVLTTARAQAIADRLGLGPAQNAPPCLGCHADPAPAGLHGARFQISDGVGCEACHGGSGGWLASHYTLRASHAANVARGLIPLDQAKARAAVCLNCHFGAAGAGQFVSHRIMSAGHPRLSFEMDLFSGLQRHYDLNAGYARRKALAPGVQLWAVGQAMALDRSLGLFGSARGQEGVFPEFYFFDCHSCHRAISDNPAARPSFSFNPSRAIPSGMPPFDDENMIMLSAAARTVAPQFSQRFETDSRNFHLALTRDRAATMLAAGRLAVTARALADAFAVRIFTRVDTFAILNDVLGDALAPRYTDYAGGAQAVMAIDTLLSALVAAGQVDSVSVQAIRPDINRAYAAVRDPNAYRPGEFHESLQRVATAVRSLR